MAKWLTFLLICFLINAKHTFSQSLAFQYYGLKNKGDSALHIANDSNLALEYYVKSFEIANHKLSVVNLEERIKIIELSILQNNLLLAKRLFLNAIENGLSKKMIEIYGEKSKILNHFKESIHYIEINEQYDSLYKVYLNNVDVNFENSLVSLLAQDQFSRRISTIPNINKIVDPLVKKELIRVIIGYSDCEIKTKLLDLLKSKNYSEVFNDNKAMGFVNYLLLHNLRKYNGKFIDSTCISDSIYFYKMQPILLHLVQIGKENNAEYAYSIDRANCWNNFNSGVEQIYGTHLTMYNGKTVLMYPIKDIENVDKRRAEIYLNTLYEASKIKGFELPSNYKFKK
jgi:hypothetical protein